MRETLTQVIGVAERWARTGLVEVLADTPDAPPDLVWFFERDSSPVCWTVLWQSGVLRDEALLEFCYQKALETRGAIARSTCSPCSDGSAAGQTGVADAVGADPAADPDDLILAIRRYLAARARVSRVFHDPVVLRGDVPPDLRARLDAWVFAALRRVILSAWPVQPGWVDSVLEAALTLQDRGSCGLTDQQQEGTDLCALAEMLAETAAATPDSLRRLMIAALQDGDIRLASILISRSLGLRRVLVTRILIEPTTESLAILCIGLGLSRTTFRTICAGLTPFKAVPPLGPSPGRAVGGDPFDSIQEPEARAVIAYWGRRSGYLGAVRDLEVPHDT